MMFPSVFGSISPVLLSPLPAVAATPIFPWKTSHWHKPLLYSILAIWIFFQSIKYLQVKQRQKIDATSEWGRYAQNPGARGRALFHLLLNKVLPLYLLGRLFPKRAKLQKYAGDILADGLLKLGPLYIKLGQIVSSRDSIPDRWKQSLERLQDKVPAQTGNKAIVLAYKAWEEGLEERIDCNLRNQQSFDDVFVDFDPQPLAAASLGQVHKAKLRANNDTVAIKLQRPYLKQIYDQDLVFLTKIAEKIDKFGGKMGQVGGVDQSWTDIFKDAEDILYREIDYLIEAENGSRFCNDFGLDIGGKPLANCTAVSRDGESLPSAASWIRAPHVYREYCSKKVLVMEFVPSIKITDQKRLEAANVTQEEKDFIADSLGRAYLRQFCCNLFFSTDPHPGNLGVEILEQPSNESSQRVRLVFYDFGQAATLKADQADGILDIIESIVDSDVDKSIKSFQKMGVLKAGADLSKVRSKVAENYRTGKIKANKKRLTARGYAFKSPTTEGNRTDTTTTTVEETKDSEVMKFFTLPAEYAFVGRALSQMDGVGKSLDPDFDFVSAAAPWIYEIKGAKLYLREEFRKRVFSIFPSYTKRPWWIPVGREEKN